MLSLASQVAGLGLGFDWRHNVKCNVKETMSKNSPPHVTMRCQSVSSQQHADDDDGGDVDRRTVVEHSARTKGQTLMGNADNFRLCSSKKKSLAAESTKPDVASSCQTDNSTVVVNDRDKPSNFSA